MGNDLAARVPPGAEFKTKIWATRRKKEGESGSAKASCTEVQLKRAFVRKKTRVGPQIKNAADKGKSSNSKEL